MVKKHPHVLQTHGFYVDGDKKLISFDVVLSFDDPDPTGTINAIKQETEALNEGFTVLVQYDQDFSLSE